MNRGQRGQKELRLTPTLGGSSSNEKFLAILTVLSQFLTKMENGSYLTIICDHRIPFFNWTSHIWGTMEEFHTEAVEAEYKFDGLGG